MRPSFESVERRRRLLRMVLFLIILGTLPFYCLGGWLWGTSPDRGAIQTETPTGTWTPIGPNTTVTRTLLPTITPLFSQTALSPLLPTPGQFFPIFPTQPPVFIPTATQPPVIIPTSTIAPTLTFPPTNPPPPTITPLPSATPPPTETPTVLLPPTDTPVSAAAEGTQSVES